MAVIAIGDCTVTTQAALAGVTMWKVVTPTTTDDTDTIDFSTFAEEIYFGFAAGATDLNLPIANNGTSLVVPGGQDNELRTMYVLGKSLKSTGGAT